MIKRVDLKSDYAFSVMHPNLREQLTPMQNLKWHF